MIVYPLSNYNTFIGVEDATTRLSELGVGAKWVAFTAEKKKYMLVMSTEIIRASAYIGRKNSRYVDAQVMLIHADITNDGKYLVTKDSPNAYTEAKVGSLQVKYKLDDDKKSLLPEIVKAILSDCIKSSDATTVRGFNIA